MTSQAQPGPATPYPLTTPEAEAAYEAEYGPVSPGSGPVWQPGDYPEPEPEPTPYDLWLTDDPQATWDDPDLAGPADRPVRDRAAEQAREQYAAAAGIPTAHSVQCARGHLAELSQDAENRAELERLTAEPEAS